MDPAWRHARSIAAGKASGRARLEKARLEAEGLPPGAAFLKGDRIGYARAYHYWQRWAEQTVERLTGRKVQRRQRQGKVA